MIVHPFRAPEFRASDFSPQKQKGAYLETSHRELLLSETQRELKLRARRIAALATRLHREHTGDKPVLAEAEIVRVVELVGQSLENGLDSPMPLARESLVWLNGLVGTSPKRAQRWIEMVRLSIDAAESEVTFHSFLVYANQAEVVLGHLRRLAPALQFEASSEAVAREVATHFLNFCESSNSLGADEEALMGEILHQFLRNFAQLLKVGGEAELLLNLSRFWGEQIAARYECSSREWLFLLSAIEQALVAVIGLAEARTLSRYFLILQEAIPRFTFAGILSRHSFVLSGNLKAPPGAEQIDWPGYIPMATAEMLLANSAHVLPPFQQLLLAAEGPLQPATFAQFQEFSNQLLRAARPLVERSWLDWLENELRRTSEILRSREERDAAAALYQKTLDQTCQNLRQGLNQLRAHNQLAADLQLLLDEAVRSLLLFDRDFTRARPYFRQHLILTFDLVASESIWRHGHVMVSALLTSIRHHGAFAPYWQRYGAALDLLGEIKGILAESNFIMAAWPHLAAIVPPAPPAREKIEKDSGAAPASLPPSDLLLAQQRLGLTRQFLRENLLVGAISAVPATLHWFLRDSAPQLDSHSPGALSASWREVTTSLERTEPFAGSSFVESCRVLAEQLGPTLLSARLWPLSDAIAREASSKVFAAQPDYLKQTGKDGVAKCARDNALTLRRVALALAPEVVDPNEFLEAWWNELVNSYVVSRPDRLFALNRQEIVAACQRQLGDAAAELVDELLGPVLSRSTADELIPTSILV